MSRAWPNHVILAYEDSSATFVRNALSLHDELALATQKVSTPPVPPHPFMEPRLGDRLYQLKGELAWAMASHPPDGFAEDLICISFRGHRRQGSG